MHHRLSRLTGALACAALAAGTAALTSTTPSSAAEDPGSVLNLRAADKVQARAYNGWVYTDFGLRLTAPTDAVEVRAHRPDDYEGPITAEWVDAPGGARDLPVPMSSFAGLDDFVRIDVHRAGRAAVLKSWSRTVCLNGWSQRMEPDAPARSPYPLGCPHNPYTLGSVMGIQGGYSTALMDEWGQRFRLKPGTYDVVASITPDYAGFFGLSEDAASATTRLVVRDGNRNRRPVLSRAESPTVLHPAASEPQPSADPCGPEDPKPDMRSLPAWDIGLNRKGTLLRFAANVWNAGNTPLVVDGFRGDDEDHMDAYQYFFDSDGEQVCYEPVGEMHWHQANHRHWHFEDFAQYALVERQPGEEVPAEDAQEVLSTKQSFCLANTDAVDYTVPGADWHPEGTDLGTACGGRDALSVRQVLSAGSGDTYHQFRAGQAFRLKNVPDGLYWVAVRANKDLNLHELDVTNNDSYRKVRIGTNKQGERFVRVPQHGVIDEHGMVGGGF